MGDIDRIEAAKGGPLDFLLNGELHHLPLPDALTYQEILGLLNDHRAIAFELKMPEWKRERLRDAWAAHYDIPPFQQSQRLCFLVDRYSRALMYDLRSNLSVDLLELWYARRWGYLMALIDGLPSHSAYAAEVAKDPEHAQMLAEAMAEHERGDVEDSGPALNTWTPVVEAITALRDDVRRLESVTLAVNGNKVSQPPLLPRPKSHLQDALKSAKFQKREDAHQRLVHRLLPHKRPEGYTPPR